RLPRRGRAVRRAPARRAGRGPLPLGARGSGTARTEPPPLRAAEDRGRPPRGGPEPMVDGRLAVRRRAPALPGLARRAPDPRPAPRPPLLGVRRGARALGGPPRRPRPVVAEHAPPRPVEVGE